jgi:hypothetical protein
VARSLKTVPAEIQREGLSLASLQASLRGRWRGNCHPGELGSALRKLGFTRQRRWDPALAISKLLERDNAIREHRGTLHEVMAVPNR